MIILFFAIFIFIATVFENIFVLTMAFVLTLGGARLLQRFWKKRKLNFPKILLFASIMFVLTLVSMCVKVSIYNHSMHNTPEKYFIGTGVIDDLYSEGRYILIEESTKKKENRYFLYSEHSYEIGDKIRINGYYSNGYTGLQNNINLDDQRKNFVSGNFVPESIAYEFDYNKRLMMKGMHGTIYEQNSVYVGKTQTNIIRSLRSQLQKQIVEIYGENRDAGLILGMLIGDRSQMSKADYDGFIDSGLVHIIAVSGGNVIMIVVFLSFVLFFLPFYVRTAIILLVVMIYALICGLDSSVFRATIMGSLALIALFAGRELNIWRAMGISFIVMLLVNPYFLVYDVGFLLSFSAIIGIIYTNQYVDRRWAEKRKLSTSKFRRSLKNYIIPTIGATLGVFPVMIFFMGTINIVGILANFLVLLIVPFVMIYGFISLFIYKLLPWEMRLSIERACVWYIYQISELAVKFGIYLSTEGIGVKYAILLLGLVWFLSQRFAIGPTDKQKTKV